MSSAAPMPGAQVSGVGWCVFVADEIVGLIGDYFGGDAGNCRSFRDIFGDYRTGAYSGIVADMHAFNDAYAGANPHVVANRGRCPFV